jgi:anti-sigma regulatory factor (Ser/Thr protein kinase)
VVVAALVAGDLDALASVVDADPRFRVVATAADGASLVRACGLHRPDLVVLGPRLSAETHDLLTDLRRQQPWLDVVIEPAGDSLPPLLDELAAGARAASWHLEPDTANVATARQLVAEVLGVWGCDHLVPDAQLVVTELVTNAIVHTETSCQVSIRLAGEGIRIAVTDGDLTHQPDPKPFDLEREGGRGLLIVSSLAAAWGIAPDGNGKTVWADLVA